MVEKDFAFLLLAGPELNDEEDRLIAQFNKEIFIPSFPNDDERESMEDIKARIIHDPKSTSQDLVRTLIVLMFGKGESDAPHMLGGEICDWYPSTGDLEIIYLAVNPASRGKRLGQRILQEGTARIVEVLERDASTQVRRLYFETENPERIQKADTLVMPISDRLRFFGRNGGSVVLEHYLQPPLSAGKNWADNMMLCTLPVFRYVSGDNGQEKIVEAADLESSVSQDELREFLTIFYEGLGVAYSEEGRQKLEEMLKPVIDEKGRIQMKRIETASFTIPYATISSHYFIGGTKTSLDYTEEDPIFNSYECDLMQYGMQDYPSRPVVTHHHHLVDLKLKLPEEYQYESEGRRFVVKQYSNQEIAVKVSFNWSYHRKYEKYLATMVICPADNAAFSEWDILKIIALLGIGSKQENFKKLKPLTIIETGTDGERRECSSFEELVKTHFNLKKDPVQTGLGITEIDLLDMTGVDVPKTLKDFNSIKDDALSDGPSESVLNKTLCGFFLGIFDFMRMNQGEIADTINPFLTRESYFVQISRGNLIKISFNSTDERIDELLTSPYLIIPSAVLAFNERVLKDCKDEIKWCIEDGRFQYEKMQDGIITNFDRFSILSLKIKELENKLADNYIWSVFQYPSEQLIFHNGFKQRALNQSYAKTQETIKLMKSRAEEYKARDTGSINAIQSVILMLLAILQVANITGNEVTPFWWMAMALTVLAAIGIFLRKKISVRAIWDRIRSLVFGNKKRVDP